MYDIPKALQALFDMIKQLAFTKNTAIEHQSEKQVIKDKGNYKKATNIAEKIIIISNKYVDTFLEKDKKTFEKLVNKFNRYN